MVSCSYKDIISLEKALTPDWISIATKRLNKLPRPSTKEERSKIIAEAKAEVQKSLLNK